jgi:branched-chain amino acid transport system permease protein
MNPNVHRVLIVLAIMALAVVPLSLGRYNNYVFSLWLVTAIAAMGVNLIMGYAGQETLAQAGFMGVGAYLTALMIKGGALSFTLLGLFPVSLAWTPFHLFTAFFASGLVCFLLGILIGFPALRVQKHYLAFVTLAFTVFLWLVFRNEEWLTGGVFGIQDIPRSTVFGVKMSPSRTQFANYSWLVLIVTLLLALLMWWLVKSPWGRAFVALRENPVRAESLGIDVRRYTLLAFAIGSAYGGFAGALYAPLVEFIDPAPFSLAPSLLFLLMIVVGGMGSFFGPFIGAAVAVLLPLWIETGQSKLVGLGFTWAQHGSYILIYATLVIVMIAFMPRGIAGLFIRNKGRSNKSPSPLSDALKAESAVKGTAS